MDPRFNIYVHLHAQHWFFSFGKRVEFYFILFYFISFLLFSMCSQRCLQYHPTFIPYALPKLSSFDLY
jgi:hypothetical protein